MVESKIQGITIWLSSPYFFAGDEVTGAVCLDVGQIPVESLSL